MGWTTATIFFWASVLSITFPSVLVAFGVTGTFCFYVGLNLCAFCMVSSPTSHLFTLLPLQSRCQFFLLLPESKQRTLEELNFIFAVPTSTFIRYQFSKAVPYFCKRYIFLRKRERPVPLYHLDDPVAIEVVEEVSSKRDVEAENIDSVDSPN